LGEKVTDKKDKIMEAMNRAVEEALAREREHNHNKRFSFFFLFFILDLVDGEG
jgi:hypothetical protein